MGLRRIWTISHGRLDYSSHRLRGRALLAPAIRVFLVRKLPRDPGGLSGGPLCLAPAGGRTGTAGKLGDLAQAAHSPG
jgi:hypothetical protein